MSQDRAGEAELVISAGVISVNAQRVTGEAERGGGIGAAVCERGQLDQGREIVGVLLQARLEFLRGLHVGSLAGVFLALEVKAVNGIPIEAG